jgi:hypothetical protein
MGTYFRTALSTDLGFTNEDPWQTDGPTMFTSQRRYSHAKARSTSPSMRLFHMLSPRGGGGEGRHTFGRVAERAETEPVTLQSEPPAPTGKTPRLGKVGSTATWHGYAVASGSTPK